ncbi:CPBP family intramembrane glutamic endopeptidase [Anaerococcus sp. ENR1011]|uniref:CPBP family intramembrane glutamic endopeptidase n=1 Tax=Anaerococcus groningensis TaxID=3115616 RepID=A0ABW9MZL3_9FIRM
MFEDNLTIRETKKIQKNRNPVLVVLAIIFLLIFPKLLFEDIFILKSINNINAIKNLAPNDRFILTMLYGTAISSILMYIFAKKYLNRNNLSLGLSSPDKIKNYLKGALIGLVMISGVFLQLKIYNQSQISLNISNVPAGVFLVFFIGWIIQGFNEELMCRSILMNYFAAFNGVKSAIITNSLIFAILHLGNDGFGIFPFINIFLMGVIFSLLFYLSDDIFLPAAAHTFWNFAQANVYGINVSGITQSNISLIKTQLTGNPFLTGGAFGVEGGFITFWIEVIVVGVLLGGVKNKSKEKENKSINKKTGL